MHETRVNQIAEGWKNAKEQLYTPEYALVFQAILRGLTQGKPVPMEMVIASTGLGPDEVEATWKQIVATGAATNMRNEITGSTLSLAPSSTIFEVGEKMIYAWCALDAIFLPAFLGMSAKVRTLTPNTGEEINLEIGPEGIHSSNPEGAVLSIDVLSLDDERSGAFCALNHMFSSANQAEAWVGTRENIEVLSLDETWHVVKTGWIEPFTNALNSRI